MNSPSSISSIGDLADRVVIACWRHPIGWRWFVLEEEPDGYCFGLVDGYYTEFGYFNLDDLRRNGAYRLEDWQPKTIGEVLEEFKREALGDAS